MLSVLLTSGKSSVSHYLGSRVKKQSCTRVWSSLIAVGTLCSVLGWYHLGFQQHLQGCGLTLRLGQLQFGLLIWARCHFRCKGYRAAFHSLCLPLPLQDWVVPCLCPLPTVIQVHALLYVTLLENIAFVGVIKIKMSSYWIRTAPESIVTCVLVGRGIFGPVDKET